MWSVMNVKSESSPRFDTNRMLLLSGDTELQPVKGVRWASYLPELLAETWANSLEANHLAALTQVDSNHHQTPTLNLYIRDFQAELDSNEQIICRVRLTLALKIPGESDARIRQFSQQQVVAQQGNGGIAHSFNQAHEQIMLEALEWLSSMQPSGH